MKATIYNPATGQILRAISAGRQADLQVNLSKQDVWIEGFYLPNKFYVDNEAAIPKPPKPDYTCYFDYSIKQWIWDEAASWSDFRRERNRRLSACDWTQVPDAPVDHAAWAVYRQQLRDLPDNTTDPRSPPWPTPPA